MGLQIPALAGLFIACLFSTDVIVSAAAQTSGCPSPLGMQNGWIDDSSVTATTFLSLEHDPGRARLNSTGAWMPRTQGSSEILQVHFHSQTNVSGVAIQGHPTQDYWVTRYRVDFSKDGVTWESYPQELTGSTDRSTPVKSQFTAVRPVRYLRVKPTAWNNGIAIRLEIYGCEKANSNCGKRPLYDPREERIIGGQEAAKNTWPWMVDVTVNNTGHWCGGSIIDPHWVVTAGHCVVPWSPRAIGTRVLRFAEHDSSRMEGYEQYAIPDRIHLHPGFVIGGVSHPGYYDIALLHLGKPIQFSDRIQPICLPQDDTEFPAGKMCYLTGWGETVLDSGVFSPTLKQLKVPLVNKSVCNSNNSYSGIIHEQFMCAGYNQGGQDGCLGDSGGPLSCQTESGDWVLTGLMSWGEKCALPDKYGVYTDVRRMLPFIESTLYGYPKCGIRYLPSGPPPESRIVGGREAPRNSWPWQVEIILKTPNLTTHYCGGSLIDPYWILTSSHCFWTYNNISTQFEIRLGEHDVRKYEGFEEIIQGDKLFIHPGLVVGDLISPGDYDVALIKLKRPAVFHKRVHSVCLPSVTANLTTGTKCYVTGWGKTAEGSPYSLVLNEVEVDIVSKEVCNANDSYNGTINDRYFCAGFPQGGRDSCGGDSGGPLVCPNADGQYVLRGVVSWGEGCARPKKYGVYLDVRRILPFIEGTIEGYPKCGIRYLPSGPPPESRIVGGREAPRNSWPWQVEIILKTPNLTTHYCGGSLIDPYWILTSSHCFWTYNNISTQFEIRLGEHDERKIEGYEEIIQGDQLFIHPGLVVGDLVSPGDYDVALIKLKRPAVFHKRVHSVCLPSVTANLTTGTKCFVTGWGKTAEGSPYSPVLNEVEVDIVSKEVCNANDSYNGTINDRYFCAGFPQGGRDSCGGDSGGPLVCSNADGQYVLRGVVSWGEGCARPKKYGVYLDVRRTLPFIEGTIQGYPKCGVRYLPPENNKPQPRIVGGREASPNSWPWQVDLVVNGTRHNCGGSLIDKQWVVTSGHCFDQRPYAYIPLSYYEFRLGEHRESTTEGWEEIIKGEKLFIHPKYKLGGLDYTGDYDIALVKLKRPAVFYKRVHSVCLPEKSWSPPDGAGCYVTGWGRTAENEGYSDVLREAQVRLVSRDTCNASYSGIINERYICAGYPGGGVDSCGGDSGGPLVCPRGDGSFVLTGIVSWGKGCARPNYVGVYLQVTSMMSFINETISANS